MSSDGGARQRIIDTASRLFQKQGYHATGLNQILKESGAPKGSLYYYFPGGKEDLGVCAVHAASAAIRATVLGGLDAHDDPVDGVCDVIDGMRAALDRDGRLEDSSLGVVALETWDSSDAIRSACAEAFSGLESAFRDSMIRGGIDRDRAEDLGVTIEALIEGAIMLSLTQRTSAPLKAVRRSVVVLVDDARGVDG